MDKETRKTKADTSWRKKKKTITIVLRIVFEIFQGQPYDRFYEPMKNYAKSPIYWLLKILSLEFWGHTEIYSFENKLLLVTCIKKFIMHRSFKKLATSFKFFSPIEIINHLKKIGPRAIKFIVTYKTDFSHYYFKLLCLFKPNSVLIFCISCTNFLFNFTYGSKL
jgi:hypothetical protein